MIFSALAFSFRWLLLAFLLAAAYAVAREFGWRGFGIVNKRGRP